MTTPGFDATAVAQNATKLMKAFDKQATTAAAMQPLLRAMATTLQAVGEHPQELADRTFKLYQQQLMVGANFLQQMMSGDAGTPVIAPDKDDRRFGNPAWDQAWPNLLKQSYLLASKYMHDVVNSAKGVEAHTHQQAKFLTKQITDMTSPGNSAFTNPEVLQTALETNGQSLVDGLKNMMSDMEQGRVSMTDYQKFVVGETIAVTPGEVVLQNKLVELIQYKPQGDKVQGIPLLICPPWINRYYILDLQPHNSLVNFLVGQGYQVFMISWKNPDASYRDVTFDDYLKIGFLESLDAVQNITGAEKVNTLGYCIGGAMLACATALLNSKGDTRINTTAFLTTLADYGNTGELGVFIDEEQLALLDAKMQRDGVLDGRDMASTFSSLRSADLVWSYVINNYLMGKQPAPFDILYWNDDSTRMPCAMHSWYLRNFYLENNIAKKNKLTLLGTPLDITNITQPAYMLCGQADHITPWLTCYKPFAAMKSTTKRFILSKSGHVAGVVNPPTPAGKPIKKNLQAGSPDAPTGEAWLATSTEVPDSWWPDYAAWLKPYSGESVAAPKTLGSKAYKPIMAAPGIYVKER